MPCSGEDAGKVGMLKNNRESRWAVSPAFYKIKTKDAGRNKGEKTMMHYGFVMSSHFQGEHYNEQ